MNNKCHNCNKEMFDINDIVILDQYGNNTFDSNAKVKTVIKNDEIFIVCPFCDYHNETIAIKTKDIGIQYRLK